MNSLNPRASCQAFENHDNHSNEVGQQALLRPNVTIAKNTAEKQQHDTVGTRPAVNYLTLSVVPPSVSTWGGRRNSASRTSDSLSLNHAANIIAAARYASDIGLPFNRHVTIHWLQAGITDERAAWATGRFIKLASDWISKRGGQFAWAWVRENGHGKGSHVHILLHLPAGTQLGHVQRRWLRSITGRTYRARTVRTVRIGGTAGAALTAPAAYQANLMAVVGYILKGATPAAARELGLQRREAGGRITGKRSATSQNIGRAARCSGLSDKVARARA